jgi:hypothetical protein
MLLYCNNQVHTGFLITLYYDTVLYDNCSETQLLYFTDFKGFSISLRRSKDVLPASFFLVDHSPVEWFQSKRSGNYTGHNPCQSCNR